MESQRFKKNQHVLYHNPNSTSSHPVMATIEEIRSDNQYLIRLLKGFHLLDPQTGEIFVKVAGDYLIAQHNQLSQP